jgi:hypothetical protein
MAYQSWSVVFGEQPSAAKWNILGTNDASFNDGSGIQPSNPIISSSSYLDLRGATSTGVKLHAPRQDDTTNSYPTGLLIQHGWGYVAGDNVSRSINDTEITFPTAYTSAPIVVVSGGLANTGAAPTSITGFGVTSNTTAGSLAISTTGFTATVRRISTDGADPGVFATGSQYAYQWIAIGVK